MKKISKKSKVDKLSNEQNNKIRILNWVIKKKSLKIFEHKVKN